VAITYFGLEGLALPELKRFGRHHVIVAIDEDRGLRRILLIVAEDDGVTGRLVDFYGLYTEAFEMVAPVFSATLHIRLMFALGTDRRDADELEEVFEEASFVLADIILDLAHNSGRSEGQKYLFEARQRADKPFVLP
jgi:hypothetical protein